MQTIHENRIIRKHSSKGYVFVLAMSALLFCFILGVSSVQVANRNLWEVSRSRGQVEALELSEAAENLGEAYAHVMAPTTGFRYPATGDLTLPNGTCHLTATLDTTTNAWLPTFKLVGTSQSNRRTEVVRSVTAKIVAQSFSQYGYFEDTGLSNNYWVTGLSTFYGPFHSNGNGGTRQTNIVWDKNASGNPYDPSWPYIFRDVAETACSNMAWGTSGQPATDAQWHMIFQGGQAALKLNAAIIPMPTTAGTQQSTAWGSTSGYPTSSGVYVNSTINSAGIYIKSGGTNDVGVTFSVNASGYQVITIYQTSTNKTTQLTVDLPDNATTVKVGTGQNPSSWTSTTGYTGVPNGVLYCTGNMTVQGLLGDNYVNNNVISRANYWTVATDFGSGADITILNNLAYQHAPNFSLSLTDPLNLRCPALGLVADQILIGNGTSSITPDSNYDHTLYTTFGSKDLVINAVMMAMSTSTNGSIYVSDVGHRLDGNLYIMGGSVVKTAAITGQFNNGSPPAIVYGYNEHYSYDPRMAQGPLTAFPYTNTYKRVYWSTQ